MEHDTEELFPDSRMSDRTRSESHSIEKPPPTPQRQRCASLQQHLDHECRSSNSQALQPRSTIKHPPPDSSRTANIVDNKRTHLSHDLMTPLHRLRAQTRLRGPHVPLGSGRDSCSVRRKISSAWLRQRGSARLGSAGLGSAWMVLAWLDWTGLCDFKRSE